MRILRRIQLAGMVVLAGAGATQQAAADDLTVGAARTDPVFTATAAGAPASPGDVTVTSAGTITIDGVGEAAITVNSNNDVTMQGTLASTNVNNTGGIHILNGFSGFVNNSGAINFTDGYVLTDTDNDGDLDGEFATGTGRYGIMLDAGSYTGNITNTGAITVEGNDSGAIILNGLIDGDGTTTGNFTNNGTISVIGDNSVGVAVLGGAVGDVRLRGGVQVFGENAQGILVDGGAIGGELRLNGNIRVTGFHHINRPPASVVLEPEDLLLSQAAVEIRQSVAGGITIEGIGLVDDDDDDGDGTNDEAGDNDTADIVSYGSAPGILILADGNNVVLGDTPAPGTWGLTNFGDVTGTGIYANVDAVGMRIAGVGANTVTTSGGLYNEGVIHGNGREGSATGLIIGHNASVPTINNLGEISAASVSESSDFANALVIEATATNVGALDNTGSIRAVGVGNDIDAVAIRDLSGQLTSIDNQGQISASVTPSDAEAANTNTAIAIDLSAAASDVTITQTENANTEVNEIILGDILLGDFNDVIDLEAGTISSNVSFGLGADQFNIDGANFVGTITSDSGDLDITVLDGELRLTGGATVASDVTFGAGSSLVVDLSGDALDPELITADTVTFAADATVIPNVPQGLIETTQTFLTANAMFGGNNVVGVVDGEGTPFVYNLSIALTNPLAADGAANGLEASYTLKTPAQLGLTENQTAAFDPIIEALRLDNDAADAFVGLDDQAAFDSAYRNLMPSFASAAAEITATAVQQGQGATSNRLSAVRLQGLDEVSAWVQEIGYGLSREPPDANGQEFRGAGFGVAAGIDGPLDNGALFGLSMAFIASEVEEPVRPEGEISTSIGQFNAYLGSAMGPFDLDFIGGLGIGQMESRRFVEIGEDYEAVAEAQWMAWEAHGAARISAPMNVGDWLVVTPQAALTYVVLNEEGYTEEGGGDVPNNGDAISYDVDSATSQRLWGDIGVEFAGRLRTGARGIIAPRIFAGYRANLIDEASERTFRFASGGDDFTLTDAVLGEGGPLVGAGIDFSNGYSTVAVGYEGEFGEQIERHSLNVSVRFRF